MGFIVMSRLTRPSLIHALLDELKMQPSKSLGQNFLIDAHCRDRIVEAADIQENSRVVEVGPGLGALTEKILDLGATVTSIEIDDRLAGHLRKEFGTQPGFTLLHQDALKTDFQQLFGSGGDRFVSNLPYSVGSRILMDIFSLENAPDRMAVTVQMDVAERLAAQPRTAAYSLLGIWAQIFFEVSILKKIKPTCFTPVPRVDSGIVAFRKRAGACGTTGSREQLLHAVKFAFTRRRKQLGSTGRAAPPRTRPLFERLFQDGVPETSRPEEVHVDQWRALLAGD